MITIDSTSDRLHSELVWLLFLQTHRETLNIFTSSGVRTGTWVGCGCFFLPWVGKGKRKRQDTFIRVIFRSTTRVFKHPHFLCYILYVEQWGTHFIMFQTITNDTPDPRGSFRHVFFCSDVISVICYLMCIGVCTSYYCKLVVGLRTQFCTLVEVWGARELPRMLTLDTKSRPSFRTFHLPEMTTLT
jgi:hypothetical protein